MIGPGGGRRRGGGRRLAGRPVRAAADGRAWATRPARRWRRSRARRGPPRAARGGRLGRRAPGPVRRAGDPGRRERRVARHDLRGAPDAGPGPGPRDPRPHRRAGPDARRRRCAAALAGLDRPALVVAQAGNVNTGALRPAARRSCAAVRANGGWLHVDGAFGLWAAADPSRRHLVEGVGEADSWTTDAHKWLNVPYDSGLSFVRRPGGAPRRDDARARRTTSRPTGGERDPYNWVPESSRRRAGSPIWAALAVARPGRRRGADRADPRPRPAVRGRPRRRRRRPGSSTTSSSTRCWCGSRTRPATRRSGDARTDGDRRGGPGGRRAVARRHDLARPARDADLGLRLGDVRRRTSTSRWTSIRRLADLRRSRRRADGALWSNQPARRAARPPRHEHARGPPTRPPGTEDRWASAPRRA